MARMSWEYLAGLFDGEGNLHTAKTGCLRWSLAQSRPRGLRICREVQQFLVAQGYRASVVSSRYSRRSTPSMMHYVLVQEKRSVQAVCHALLPFVRIKKIEVQDVWRFLLLYPPLRQP